MLHKMTRVDLIEAHSVLWEKIMDNDITPFVNCQPVAREVRARAVQLDNIMTAVLDYAAVVLEDTYAHLDMHGIYGRSHLAALQDAAKALNKLLMAHAGVLERRGQPDDAV